MAERSRALKILMHHRIASFDGQAVHISKLAAALRDLGCEVLIVGPPVVKRLPVGKVLPAVDSLRRRLPQRAYEGLELAYTGIALLRLLWAWFRFKPDVLYERFNLFQPAGYWLKRLTGIPLLLEVNAPLLFERSLQRPLAFQRLATWSERIVLRGADRVLPVSHSLARLLETAGVPPDRIAVVPNGADRHPITQTLSGDAAKESLGLRGRTVIGFVGFVRAWHKLDWAIDVVSREGVRRNLHLLLVGDSAEVCDATPLASSRLNGRLTVTGAVAPNEVSKYLAAVDIAVQPGATEYASPIKIFEYMAQGRAIVAPDTANIREILDESCAVLFDPDDRDAFSAAVLRLCDNPAERNDIGRAARQRLLDMGLTWQHAAERVRAVALEVASTSGKVGLDKSVSSRGHRAR